MSEPPLHDLVRYVHRLAGHPGAALSDTELLTRFVEQGDEAAFEALVWRHAQLVWGLCRRMLRCRQDAEDAFQASFLVLARKARSVRKRNSVGSWLYKVTQRIALELRKKNQQASAVPLDQFRAKAFADDHELAELRDILQAEINALPVKYRLPTVLHYLDGKSTAETAAIVGCPAGTILSRLAWARRRLQSRLTRRGLAGAIVLGAATSVEGVGLAPATCVLAAVSAALAFNSVNVITSSRSSLIAQQVLRTMLMSRLLMSSLAIVGIMTVSAGLGMAVLPKVRSSVFPSAQQPDPATAAFVVADAKERMENENPRAPQDDDPLPEGAIARLGTTAFRHEMPNQVPAFSGDGKLLATGSGRDVCIWNPTTGKLLRTISGVEGANKLLFAPDGRWLACRLSANGLGLFNPLTGALMFKLPASGPALACSHDGKMLIAGGGGATVTLWDTTTGADLGSLAGGATQAAFTTDGKHLITVGGGPSGKSIYHWDLASRKLENQAQVDMQGVTVNHRLSPDGRFLAISTRDRPQRPQLPARFAVAPPPKSLSPGLFIIDTATGQERFRLKTPKTPIGFALAFSDDSKILVTTLLDFQEPGQQGEASVWDTETGKLLKEFALLPRSGVHIALAPVNHTLVGVGFHPRIFEWDIRTGKAVNDLSSVDGTNRVLAFSPDGNSLLSASSDGALRLWGVRSGRPVRNLQGHSAAILAAIFSIDGKSIISGAGDGSLRWQSLDGKVTRQLMVDRSVSETRPKEAEHYTQALAISPDGTRASEYDSSRDGVKRHYRTWDLSNEKEIVKRAVLPDQTPGYLFSPDARLVFSILQAGPPENDVRAQGNPNRQERVPKVVVEDIATGTRLLEADLPTNTYSIAAISPSGDSFATITEGNRLDVRERAPGKERYTFRAEKSSKFTAAAYSADGRVLATARDDQIIQFWALATGNELQRFSGFVSKVQLMTFSPDGRLLGSGHGDGTILIWKLGANAR